jgi:DNA-binding CsgD family transcriptional regulator
MTQDLLFDPSVLDCSGLWNAIVGEPGVGVAILTRSGRVEFANGSMTHMVLGDASVDVRAKEVSELLPAEPSQQIKDVIDRLAESKSQIVRRTIWAGKPVQATYSWIDGVDGADERVLVVARVGFADDDAVAIEYSPFVELGNLDLLTARELEVLEMLGRGMRIKEIADTLHRSPKTVENHKDAIGRKLKETDRARLTRIAVRAGLEPGVTERKRVRLKN